MKQANEYMTETESKTQMKAGHNSVKKERHSK
jgi:hypothetical protein